MPPRALGPTFQLRGAFQRKKKRAPRGVTDTSLYRKMALLGCAALVLEKTAGRSDIFQNFMRFVEREITHFTTLCSLKLHLKL